VEVGTLPSLHEPSLVEGNLHTGNKRVLRRDAQCLGSPLSATKLTVSDSWTIPRKWIRFRSGERGELTGRNQVCRSLNQSNSCSCFSVLLKNRYSAHENRQYLLAKSFEKVEKENFHLTIY